MKQYKTVSPRATIRAIKDILQKNGIFTKAEVLNAGKMLFSARVCIANGKLAQLNIGTNGKGKSQDFALASGYAELMERLQTRFLYPDMLRFPSENQYLLKNNRFSYAPDESQICIKESEFNVLLKTYFPKTGHLTSKWVEGEFAFSNMFSVFDKQTRLVPIELLRCMTGSTGCCAGNTSAEAIVQGICEIFERHALQLVYLNCRQGLPNIPPSIFGHSSAIKRLETVTKNYNLKYAIKDCSWGLRIPVVGLLLWNDDFYQFKLGSATDPNVALMRCLTEIFQGCIGNERFLSRNPRFMVASSQNYEKSKLDGSGHWPEAIFNGTDDGRLENFTPFKKCNINQDYEVLKKILNEEGYEILIQDCSFLGFPSFYIYIPGLSDTYPQLYDFNEEIKRREALKLSVSAAWNPSKSRLLPTTEITPPQFNAAYRPSKYPPALYKFAIAFAQKQYMSALDFFSGFLHKYLSARTPYNIALHRYIQLKAQNHPLSDIPPLLYKEFPTEIAKQVIRDFESNQQLEVTMSLPACFECTRCPTQSQCALQDILRFDADLREKHLRWTRGKK